MKSLLLTLSLFCCFSLSAQYYYKDIIVAQETSRLMQTYIANKVMSVSAVGYLPNGAKATDFSEVQEVKDQGKTLRIVTIENLNRTENYNHFDDKHRLISIVDSSPEIVNTTKYEYDDAGRIISMENVVKDTANGIDQVEVHKWYYNQDGKPGKMWRIVNNTDSIEVRFTPDEKGNPGEEISYRNGREIDHLYYYFDEKNRLTDIVRFNKKIQKLVPDEIISYDDNDRVIQVITSSQSDNIGMGKRGRAYLVRYVTSRYGYNDKGLKTADVLFNAENERNGSIRYTYTFSQ